MNTPDLTPSMCQFTWRLHGETRMVQCGMDYGHGGTFHQRGIFVTSATTAPGDTQRLPVWLSARALADAGNHANCPHTLGDLSGRCWHEGAAS